jgi:AraC-like DNA-binding protein
MTFKEAVLSAPGKQAFHARLYYNQVSPGKRAYIAHSHPAMEIGYFNNCHGTFTLKDKQYSIEPGDIFIFRSNEQHHVTEIQGDDDIVSMGFHFFPDLFWSHSNDTFDAKYTKIFSVKNNSFENRLERNSPVTAQIRHLLDLICEEFDTQNQDYGLMIKSYLIAILVLVIRQYDLENTDVMDTNVNVTGENLRRIQNVMDYIDQHITDDLTLKELSAVANMSTSYFSQLFKELNGFSAWDYIISKRVDQAQKRLISSTDSIYSIALQSGFNNTTNFYKAFKKITGVSPSTYRKN